MAFAGAPCSFCVSVEAFAFVGEGFQTRPPPLAQITRALRSIVLINVSIRPDSTYLAMLSVNPLAVWNGTCDGIEVAVSFRKGGPVMVDGGRSTSLPHGVSSENVVCCLHFGMAHLVAITPPE